MPVPETFADLLNERREALKMTQRTLRAQLKRAGVKSSAQSISAWHSNRAIPKIATVLALLQVLAVPSSEHDRWKLLAFAGRPGVKRSSKQPKPAKARQPAA